MVNRGRRKRRHTTLEWEEVGEQGFGGKTFKTGGGHSQLTTKLQKGARKSLEELSIKGTESGKKYGSKII